MIATAARHGGEITIAQLRDELGTSRKFAQGLLEHFDAERVTIRRGDVHVVRRSAQGPGRAIAGSAGTRELMWDTTPWGRWGAATRDGSG